MGKTVIITGASGFIGKRLCQRLVENGYAVIALSRNPDRTRPALGEKVTVLRWSEDDARPWSKQADGVYGIINLAGENIGAGRWTKEKKERIVQSRLNAGRIVLEAVNQIHNKPQIVIQASGISIYGDPGDRICDESTAAGSGFLPDVARQWEDSTRAVTSFGTRHVVIRSAVVLGGGEGFLPRVMLPFRFGVGGHFGSGRQWLSWIHIEDEVRAIHFLLDHEDASGVFNLCAPNPVTSKIFSKSLGRAIGKPSWFPTPGPLLRLFLGEMAQALILSGQRAVPKRLLDLGFTFTYPELEAALQSIFASGSAFEAG